MADRLFFDTSVLVYAFDLSESEKHKAASELIEDAIINNGGAISGQVLLELYNVLTRFVTNPMPHKEAAAIVEDFINADAWLKLDYDIPTVKRAIETASHSKVSIWDALIAETMRENGIYTIVTENEKDFKKINGIEIINPFKQGLSRRKL